MGSGGDVGLPCREQRHLGWEELGRLGGWSHERVLSRESEVIAAIGSGRVVPKGRPPPPVSRSRVLRVSACLTLTPPGSAPSAMCEMIKIMQEYGEVTCCLGSSANLRNSCLFLQSDIRSGGRHLYLRETPDSDLHGLGHVLWPNWTWAWWEEGTATCSVPWEMGFAVCS